MNKRLYFYFFLLCFVIHLSLKVGQRNAVLKSCGFDGELFQFSPFWGAVFWGFLRSGETNLPFKVKKTAGVRIGRIYSFIFTPQTSKGKIFGGFILNKVGVINHYLETVE